MVSPSSTRTTSQKKAAMLHFGTDFTLSTARYFGLDSSPSTLSSPSTSPSSLKMFMILHVQYLPMKNTFHSGCESMRLSLGVHITDFLLLSQTLGDPCIHPHLRNFSVHQTLDSLPHFQPRIRILGTCLHPQQQKISPNPSLRPFLRSLHCPCLQRPHLCLPRVLTLSWIPSPTQFH